MIAARQWTALKDAATVEHEQAMHTRQQKGKMEKSKAALVDFARAAFYE
jgi:hypothetical protein